MKISQIEKMDKGTLQIMDNIRPIDDPRFKEPIIAQLHGMFLNFLDEQGLTKGKEYESQIRECFSCSQRYIHIWDNDNKRDCQIVVYFCSTQFMLEFGVYNKKKKKVIYRNKLENLRYKISQGTEVELIDSHQEKFNAFFKDFKKHFQKLKQEIKK